MDFTKLCQMTLFVYLLLSVLNILHCGVPSSNVGQGSFKPPGEPRCYLLPYGRGVVT